MKFYQNDKGCIINKETNEELSLEKCGKYVDYFLHGYYIKDFNYNKFKKYYFGI